MPKDIIDKTNPLAAPGKDKMLRDLLEHGLDEEELKTVLFDYSLLQPTHERIKNLVYKKYRDKLNVAISDLSSLLSSDIVDDRYYGPTWAEKESLKNKRDALYSGYSKSQMTKSIKKATREMIFKLFDIILPVIEKINQNEEYTKYFNKDAFELIAALCAINDPQITYHKIKNLYKNNSK